jgi:hypothetical protein
MGSLLPGLRRAAMNPFRLVHRLRRVKDHLLGAVERTEQGQQNLAAALADFGHRQAQLQAQLGQLQTQLARHAQQSNKLQLLGALVGKLPPLEQLRLLYPWPEQRPPLPPSTRGWDGGGRDIVTRRMVERRVGVVLEIGSFLGLSTRTWLSAVPDATIICIDPWYDHYDDDSGFRHWPDVVGKNIYHLFLSSCWEFRDRIIPVRGTSPTTLQVVADLGVQPDLVYIDGDHAYESAWCDIETSHRLFPRAILTGDDWTWDKHTHPPRAVREAVEDFAAARNWRVEASGNTWALDR